MNAKHTPGPWRIVNKPRLSSLEVYAGDTAICELWRRADRAAEHATAQLIAAAPDLLEALTDLRRRFHAACLAGGSDAWAADASCAKADAAIAKAENGK